MREDAVVLTGLRERERVVLEGSIKLETLARNENCSGNNPTSTAPPLLSKALYEITRVFLKSFKFLVKDQQNFYTLDTRNAVKNPVSHICGLGKQSW